MIHIGWRSEWTKLNSGLIFKMKISFMILLWQFENILLKCTFQLKYEFVEKMLVYPIVVVWQSINQEFPSNMFQQVVIKCNSKRFRSVRDSFLCVILFRLHEHWTFSRSKRDCVHILCANTSNFLYDCAYNTISRCIHLHATATYTCAGFQ